MEEEILEEILKHRETTFAEFLFQLIEEENLTASDIYHKAGLHRKIFYDIRHKKNYKPSKETIIKIIFALELSIDDAQKLLSKAGYTLSKSNDFDLIVEHFIATKNFNLPEIDAELYKRNLPCIFSKK